jgi:hypothetical protein
MSLDILSHLLPNQCLESINFDSPVAIEPGCFALGDNLLEIIKREVDW